MRAVIYTRVSTDDQLRGTSLDDQERVCREHAARMGWDVVALYRDEGISGRKENRPQFQAMIGNIHDQAIKFVVVYKWDRFARSTRIALESINRINTAGAAVVSVTEPIDDRTAAGRFNRDMMLSVAQLYSEMLAERMRLAFASKARSGKWVGSVPVGYVKRDGVIVP